MKRPGFRRGLVIAGVLVLTASLLSACGTIASGRKIDYRNTPTLPPLEVPPDLSSVSDQNAPPQAPGTAANATTYSGYAGEQKTQAPAASPVLPEHPDVKLVRDGQTRYVVVNAPPSAVWDQVKEFLTRTGLVIASQDPKAGLIETEWAENRALVGAGENIVTKMVRSLQSTGTRDKYHVRLENGVAPGTTEIYIAHRGMEELEPDKLGESKSGWKPRPSDPELEAEMLHRLVAQLTDERTANRAVASAPTTPAATAPAPVVSARLTRNGTGASLLTLEDGLDRAWRRVGLSLDRIGFTVEDRDRSKGIYYVRYIDPETKGKEKGFFSRMFTKDEPAPPNQFQVQVKRADNGSTVEVFDKEGAPAVSTTGERILSLLYEQLK